MKEKLIILDGVDYERRKGETDDEYEKRIDDEYFAIHGRHHPTEDDLTPEMRAMVENIAKHKVRR